MTSSRCSPSSTATTTASSPPTSTSTLWRCSTAPAKLFISIDANDDGFISEGELDSGRNLPRDGNEARVNGQKSAAQPNAHIKPFDVNGDGVLDGEERKAMEMAFVTAALKAEKEADYYHRLGDALSVSRDIIAAKFADMVITAGQ